MALKNVKRVTFSLPKVTFKKLEIGIPKSKRSKFIADIIEKNLATQATTTFEQTKQYWEKLAQRNPRRTNKTATELLREDRQSH